MNTSANHQEKKQKQVNVRSIEVRHLFALTTNLTTSTNTNEASETQPQGLNQRGFAVSSHGILDIGRRLVQYQTSTSQRSAVEDLYYEDHVVDVVRLCLTGLDFSRNADGCAVASSLNDHIDDTDSDQQLKVSQSTLTTNPPRNPLRLSIRQALARVWHLDLSGCGLTELGDGFAEVFPRLGYLNLSRNRLGVDVLIQQVPGIIYF
jgi:hypothetical protein